MTPEQLFLIEFLSSQSAKYPEDKEQYVKIIKALYDAWGVKYDY